MGGEILRCAQDDSLQGICRLEHREGSGSMDGEILSAAKDDSQGIIQVRLWKVFFPNVWMGCYLLVKIDATCYNKGKVEGG